MTESPLRRIVWVLVSYACVGWLVLQGSEWLRRALALPVLFETLLRGALAVGVPVALLMAWRYPDIAQGVGSAGVHDAVSGGEPADDPDPDPGDQASSGA